MNKKRGVNFFNFNPRVHRRGQVTIFIILGLIIVGTAALVYFLYPTIKSTFIGITDPQGFIQSCVQDNIASTIRNLSVQGGAISPKNYFPYYNDWSDLNNGNQLKKIYGAGLYRVEYLCYVNQYYLPCVMQQPLLQAYIENEIKNKVQQTADSCFSNLQKNYKNRGFSVDSIKGNTFVDILPSRVVITFNNKLTLTKDTTQRYENFTVLINSDFYDLISIASNILNWETVYGNAPVQNYMIYYPNLVVQQNMVGASNDPNLNGRNSDGTKVYVLTDLNTQEVFQFATRGWVLPPGAGYKAA